MAKIYNPATAVTSVPISIKIDHVSVSTNDVYELYYDTFDVFMNSQNPAPTYSVTEDCQTGSFCYLCTTIFNGNINSVNWFRFSPYIAGSPNTDLNYYYVIDTTKVIQPSTLQSYWNSNYCHGSYYYICLSFVDINYFVIWVRSASRYYVEMYFQAGGAISQVTTNIVAKMWYNQRYIGTHTVQLSPTCWNQLRGGLSSVSVASTAGNNRDMWLGKKRAEVRVSFTTQNPIPATGSIVIVWPTNIPRIYPHCRSMTNLGSALYAHGSTNYDGEVGCLVQNVRHWVITGFNALPAGSYVSIVGLIDIGNIWNQYIGAG